MALMSMTLERRAQVVRVRAAELGLSLAEVATRSRLSPATVEAIVVGPSGLSPTRATLVKLARGLGLPAELLLGLDQTDEVGAPVDVEMAHPRQADATGISRTITVPVLSMSAT